MNFSPLPVILLMVGIVLIYAGIKDVDPREVVKNALKGQATVSGGFTKGVGKVTVPPTSGFKPGAGVGKGGSDGGGGSW